MANNNKTIFQRLSNIVTGAGNGSMSYTDPSPRHITASYTVNPKNDVIASFKTKEERDQKLAQMKQQMFLARQWVKTGYETSMERLPGATQVKVMYRDADLMDMWPEINAALHIISEEATTIDRRGEMLHVYSKSERIRSILNDLFNNRLDMKITLPMVVRATVKYGNEFMFLNIDDKNGVRGWRELPVHEMTRIENGMSNGYGGATGLYNLKPDEVKFVWEGHNENTPFKNWQVAHFRLVKDSIYLPYGCSHLNGARRHWRLLSMMEDAMLIYRLERSSERKIFKVDVGLIDEADVPAFINAFADKFKRAPMIDPATGQVDLRKNFLDATQDLFIPVRPGGQNLSTVEAFPSSANQTAMDDIEYISSKILSLLRVPKTFLNFQEAQGKGQNLSLMDVRFARMINSIQQAILMELNKIAVIHLALLGFDRSEWTNFTLSLNNPSSQIEMMEIEAMTKRVTLAASLLADQGDGVPHLASWKWVQKEVFGRTDAEIHEMLCDMRLEKGLVGELELTSQIIRRTGVFDPTDRIYGTPGAQYSAPSDGQQGGPGSPSGGMPMGGGFGDDLGGDELGDMGEPGASDEGDVSGIEGGQPLEQMGGEPLQETRNGGDMANILKNAGLFTDKYLSSLGRSETMSVHVPVADDTFMVNEEIDSIVNGIEELNRTKDNIIND